MKTKVLYNPTDKDIVDYKIAEAVLDADGNTTFDTMSGNYKETGKTLEWTIRAGEELEFPLYVADYLKQIYDFLEVKDEKPEAQVTSDEVKEVKEAKPQEGQVNCKYCGRNFANSRALGLHIGSKHLEKVL